MNPTFRTFVPCISALLLLVAPATADAFWWKLDKLSGPQFEGPAIQVRIWCVYDRRPVAGKPRLVSGGILSLCRIFQKEEDEEGRRRASLDVNWAWLRSDRDVRFASNETITLQSLGPSFSFRLTELFEVGTAVHAAWFYSDGLESFQRAMVEPFRLDVRFLRNPKTAFRWIPEARPPWWQEAFILRGGFVWFPQGFDNGEFGAPPDDDNAVPHFGVFADLDPIIRAIF